jgi:hypothetical protein
MGRLLHLLKYSGADESHVRHIVLLSPYSQPIAKTPKDFLNK